MNQSHYAVEHHLLQRDGQAFILDVQRLRFYQSDPRVAQILAHCDGRDAAAIARALDMGHDDVCETLEVLSQLGLVGAAVAPVERAFEPDPERVPIPSLAIQLDDRRTGQCLAASQARQALRVWLNHPASAPALALTVVVEQPEKHLGGLDDLLTAAHELAEERKVQLQTVIQTDALHVSPALLAVAERHEALFLLDLDPLFDKARSGEDLTRQRAQMRPFSAHSVGWVTLRLSDDTLDLGRWLAEMRDARPRGFYVHVVGDNGNDARSGPAIASRPHTEQTRERNSLDFCNILFPAYRLCHAQPTLYGCQAGRGHLALSAGATFYPCQCFIGQPAFKMGDLARGVDQAQRATYLRWRVDAQSACRDCWSRYLCGGGCLRDSLNPRAGLSDPPALHCHTVRTIAEHVIYNFSNDLRVALDLGYRSLHRFLPQMVAPVPLAAGRRSWIAAQGDSMWPTICDGECVQVEAAHGGEIAVGDIVLFERLGETIIHRIVGREANAGGVVFYEKGDNMNQIGQFSPSSLIGRVVAIQRGEELIPVKKPAVEVKAQAG